MNAKGLSLSLFLLAVAAARAEAQYKQVRLKGPNGPSGYVVSFPEARMGEDYNGGKTDFDPDYIKSVFPAAVVNENCRPKMTLHTNDGEGDLSGHKNLTRSQQAGRMAITYEDSRPPGEEMGLIHRVRQAQIGAATTKEIFEDAWFVIELELEYRGSPDKCNANFVFEMLDRIFTSLKASPLQEEHPASASSPAPAPGGAPSSAGPVATHFGALTSSVQPAPERKPPPKQVRGPKEPSQATIEQRQAKIEDWTAKNYLKQCQLHSAADHFQKALEMNPASYESHFAFGAVMKLMGQTNEWEEHIEKARELNSNMSKGLLGFLGGRGKKNDAEEKAMVHISNGLIQEALGMKDKALDSYSDAIGEAPGNWMGYAYRGILRAELKECGGAREDLEKAGQLNYLYKIHGRYWLARCADTR